MAGDRDVRGRLNPGLLCRFGDEEPGWGVQFGLSWFSTELDRSTGGDRTAFGTLDVRRSWVGTDIPTRQDAYQ